MYGKLQAGIADLENAKAQLTVKNEELSGTNQKLLADNGFLCQLKAVGKRHNGKAAAIEISVPVSEAEDAYEVLAQSGFQA